jgi:hypothetical protein
MNRPLPRFGSGLCQNDFVNVSAHFKFEMWGSFQQP